VVYVRCMNITSDMPSNVVFSGYAQTKSGKTVTEWEVKCVNCGRIRKIKRADHARGHAEKPCKYCSNKNNHPQGNHRGIRISFAKKYELHANARSKSWNISLDDMADVADEQKRKCALSGIKLIFFGDFDKITASLDRIDNSKGYLRSNIQWVHKDINMMKGMLTMEQFVNLCKAVADKVKW